MVALPIITPDLHEHPLTATLDFQCHFYGRQINVFLMSLNDANNAGGLYNWSAPGNYIPDNNNRKTQPSRFIFPVLIYSYNFNLLIAVFI